MSDDDLEIITGCAAAHPDQRGGQHVAKSCTAVRVLHVPTGIAVTALSERSQFKNKAKALELLRQLVEPNLTTEETEALKWLHTELPVIFAAWIDDPTDAAIAETVFSVLDKLLARKP